MPEKQFPVMHQDWRDLLFLHWKYEPELIQNTLPEGLTVDTFEGKGYLTISPLLIKNLSLLSLPSLPGFSHFVEVNVRTYVKTQNGLSGIWFYSLDINSFIAAKAARRTFFLPYYSSNITVDKAIDSLHIRGKGNRKGKRLSIDFQYEPTGDIYSAKLGTLDHFLIERYVLFTYQSGQLYMSQVQHTPYPLRPVKVYAYNDELLKINNFDFTNRPIAHVNYSIGVDVDIFYLKKII